MAYETGTRGRLLAGRLRVVGPDPTYGRSVAAVDREAPPASAAVRIALIDPALDAAGRAAWAAVWGGLAERRFVVPLIDLVDDEDLGSLAVVAMGDTQPVRVGDGDLADQAERLGAALASAGLDLTHLTLDDLGLDAEGRLLLDGVLFPAEVPMSAINGAGLLLDLLGPFVMATPREPVAVRREPRVRRTRGRRRLVIPAIVVLLVAAGAITLLPDRPTAPASIVPGDQDAQLDTEVLRALEETARPAPVATRDRPRRVRPNPAPPDVVPARVDVAGVAAEPARTPPPQPDPDALPVAESRAEGAGSGALPLAAGADALPLVAAADALPLAGVADALPAVAEEGAGGTSAPVDITDGELPLG